MHIYALKSLFVLDFYVINCLLFGLEDPWTLFQGYLHISTKIEIKSSSNRTLTSNNDNLLFAHYFNFQMNHNVAFKNGSAEDRLPMFIQTQRKEIDNKKDFCADLNRRRGQIVKCA